MNRAELEVLLLGLLRLWQVEASVRADRESEAVAARIEAAGMVPLTITWAEAPFGIIWQVTPEGRRTRTYPSVNGLIRDLRERLVPERGSARVLFAGRAGGSA
jgi:hypothetical protein